MSVQARIWRQSLVAVVGLCALSLALAGCSDTNAGHASLPSQSGSSEPVKSVIDVPPVAPIPRTNVVEEEQPDEGAAVPAETTTDTSVGTSNDLSEATAAATNAVSTVEPAAPQARDRQFAVEGPDGAVRAGFDDLDLLKVLRMDPVTPDCVEKMPGWLRGLEGKKVRIRGFMKPGLLLEGIPQFMLVRDTGLCCFGPKGKIYDMIAVTLKAGTTTSYIELRPFDVVGTFRIELLSLEDDGTIFGLYYLDDAQILQK